MILLLFLLGLALGAEPPSTDQGLKLQRGGCPPFWFGFNGRCYKYVATPLTWADAELNCVSQRANLVSIHSLEEQNFVKALIKNFDPAQRPTWTGLNDIPKEGRWMWSDGCPVKFTFWDQGQPDNSGQIEDCGQVNFGSLLKWNDEENHAISTFPLHNLLRNNSTNRITSSLKLTGYKKEASTLQDSRNHPTLQIRSETPAKTDSIMILLLFLLGLALGAEPSSDDQGVKLQCGDCPDFWYHFNGRFYKYVATRLTWAEAELNCVSQGGNLVSIHSLEEHNFVKSLIKKFDAAETWTWFGLSDIHKEGSWMWSDGCPVKYTYWGQEQPDNARGNENCGHVNLYPDLLWNDRLCSETYPSVCASRITCP
ncbi:uncharacterized protein V6R79_022020 [Siganus canaliculatus]